MTKGRSLSIAVVTSVFVAGFALGSLVHPSPGVSAQSKKVFELRTYTAPPGKLDALNARFRNHTLRIFEKHGMKNIGYWVPQDAPASQNTLTYIISHDSREAAKQSWDAFRKDPEWQKVSKETQLDGPIVEKVVSVFMDATDYSPMK